MLTMTVTLKYEVLEMRWFFFKIRLPEFTYIFNLNQHTNVKVLSLLSVIFFFTLASSTLKWLASRQGTVNSGCSLSCRF